MNRSKSFVIRLFKYSTILLFLLFFHSQNVYCQQNKIDSLLFLLKTDKEDTNKVKHLHKLNQLYQYAEDYKKALFYEEQALTLAQKEKWIKGEAKAITILE